MASPSTLTNNPPRERRAQSEPRTSGTKVPQQQTTSGSGVLGTAGKMLFNVNETMKQCLPASIASYFPASGSTAPAPVRQHKGPTGGVGSLPGTPNEEGVAKLPLERDIEARLARKHKGPTGGVGSLPGTPNEEGVARLPMERYQEVLEARRGRKHIGPTGGVGSLPGTPNEEGVATLPIERAQEKLEKMLEEKAKAGQSEVNTDPAFLTSLPDPTTLSMSKAPYTPADDIASNLSTTAQKGSEPASPLSDSPSTPPASRHVTTESPASGPSVQFGGVTNTSGGASGVHHGAHAPRKVTLKDKVKGEAKVIHGKLTKNEDDIKEGQRMKGHI